MAILAPTPSSAAANDTIRGGGHHLGHPGDSLYGGEGDDTFHWSEDALIDGGAGIDELRISHGGWSGVTVDLSDPHVETMVLGTRVIYVERLYFFAGSGNDHLSGGVGGDELIGGGGDDIIHGGTGDDILAGGDGNDQLDGGAGDDFLHDYTSDANPADLINGGEGFDYLEFWAANATGSITIDLLATTGMVTNVEQIDFTGGSGGNQVSGGAAQDRFRGGSGGTLSTGVMAMTPYMAKVATTS
jgi:Ca2+-binding RTX toxin-like protein